MEWILFLALIAALVALDLFVFRREDRALGFSQALAWSCFWIALALLFNTFIYFFLGEEAALQFFTGYLLEKALSLDNIFVIALIFASFQIPLRYQHRVLMWGIVGAVCLRALMIFLGVALLRQFSWILYLFGVFLLYTAYRFLTKGHGAPMGPSLLVAFARRRLPFYPKIESHRFFVKRGGIWLATPLFFALLQIESADVLFAVDSIPAIFAITTDLFIVFTSNIFAILGLRALYFVLAVLLLRFTALEKSLAAILGFVGLKILLGAFVTIPTALSLLIIALILAAGIGYSWLKPK